MQEDKEQLEDEMRAEQPVEAQPEQAMGEEATQTESQPEHESAEPSEEEKQETLLQAEKDKFMRLFAEFENYKKRNAKERIELIATANADLMTALLPVLDDFKRGVKELEKNFDEEALTGVNLIFSKFNHTLESKGLKVITIDKGENFDAEQHEAISQIPAPEESLKGKVIDVVEDGYKLGEKIIRFPKVVIGN